MGIQINGLTDIISATDGSLTVSGADLNNPVNFNVSGVGTVASLIATNLNVSGMATFQGNVSIAGTLTYDDVTNVDSLGIVTARKGIRITNNTAAGAAGTISSPADNVLAFGTNDLERVRIDSSGSVGIGTNNPARSLHVNGTARLADGSALEWGGTSAKISGTSADNALLFSTTSLERLRIDNVGNLGINSTSPTSKLDVAGNVKVIGVVTATSFSGSGANLTGLPAGFSELDGMLFG